GAPGVRLFQDAYHNRSFALYTRVGFRMRTTASVMQGPPIASPVAGATVRKAVASDLDACNRICFAVHGHDRRVELQDAIAHDWALLVEREGAVTGYTTGIAFFGHAAGEMNQD